MRQRGWSFRWFFWRDLRRGCFLIRARLQNPEELEEERRLCYVGMTRAMDTLILTRAHYRRRYGNDAPEMSIPSRFLEEVPSQLIENLGGRSPAWSTPAYGVGRRAGGARGNAGGDFDGQHYNYEDESQEAYNPAAGRRKSAESKPFVASWMTAKAPAAKADSGGGKPPDSLDNIARFFGGKAGGLDAAGDGDRRRRTERTD